ncbi:hypothetical protein CVD28_02060 [Bacillus sp. M6-12]|uniref:hypothetical protein n=1 Tax=Bacillus sp. M6-12 TaxID=2054166 RepID=UPI000C764492|nr:hypothetical protein [Bacillus sp. M6-12]PLS19217.1 hypothetical protein CVD28_02060 [Bacillus sp. M6-12]
MTVVKKLFQEYIQELHAHLFDNEPFEQIIQNFKGSHRRKRFVAMYLIQTKSIFYSYYERRTELQIEKLFNQIITALLYKKEQNRLKQFFVKSLELHPDMIMGKVSSYEIKEIEKDLHAFSFYQTKKELKSELE